MEDAKIDESLYDKLKVSKITIGRKFDVKAFEEDCNRAAEEKKAKELATLRDHFAGLAMHQILEGAKLPMSYDASEAFENLSIRAYQIADAMLKQRSLTNA